jgi:hypothetical protein
VITGRRTSWMRTTAAPSSTAVVTAMSLKIPVCASAASVAASCAAVTGSPRRSGSRCRTPTSSNHALHSNRTRARGSPLAASSARAAVTASATSSAQTAPPCPAAVLIAARPPGCTA